MTSPTITPPRTAPRAPSTPQPARGPQPTHQDVQAMNDAFAAVRKKQAGAQPLTPRGKAAPQEAPASLPQRVPVASRGDDPFAQERDLSRRQDSQQESLAGLLMPGAGTPPPVAAPAALPPPAVDPSAFVQLMTQLWARENGKGARDVRVQFGAATWPATGARLVRNASGALDIELHFDTAGRTPDERALERLRHGFGEQGVTLGALSTTADPIA